MLIQFWLSSANRGHYYLVHGDSFIGGSTKGLKLYITEAQENNPKDRKISYESKIQFVTINIKRKFKRYRFYQKHGVVNILQ